MFGKQVMETTKQEDQLLWFALYSIIFLAFYLFTSPFVGNPELLDSWTPYVYLSMILYAWLFSAAALHTPVHALGLLDSTIKQPISLLFPFFSASFVFLVVLELLMVLFLTCLPKRTRSKWKVANVSPARSFMNVLRNSAATSMACVALIMHCDASIDGDSEGKTYNTHACEKLFAFSSSEELTFFPASYQGAIVIWIAGMTLATTNFVLERVSGIRMISFHWFSDRSDDEEPISGEHLLEKLPPEHNQSMVPWYSMFLFNTAFQLLISLKVFLGRFDQRKMQQALFPDDNDYYFDYLSKRQELWLDFMADCGDGFNSSYQIARLLAQPQLEVDCEEELPNALGQEYNSKSKNKKQPKKRTFKRTFPRGDVLVIGGDLAYPHPEAESYETRFWRCFEYAMKPPAEYEPSALSTAKTRHPKTCASMKDYEGPSAFAIPGNHDWFDGLSTFIRFICQRDWLGGWFLPQKTSYFCLKLPHGWWLLGLDLALENDINTEQFAFFKRVAETQMKEDDAVIIVTHEPRWLLDIYEDRDDSEEKLSLLINDVLQGRVTLRLAGDIHNYSRHSVDRTSRPRFRRSRSAILRSTPKSPIPMRRSPSQRFRMLSPTRAHFPHMYTGEQTSNVSNSLDELTTRLSDADADPTLTTNAAEHLIVSGGGGAFLHPTHAPRCDTLRSNGAKYQKKACYPPPHVSKRYALLNVFGFRRINWRFDIIGGLGYFGLASSMFPRCSVGAIYTSTTWKEVAVQFGNELVQIATEMVTISNISLAMYIVMLFIAVSFADSTSLVKKFLMGLVVSWFHCLAAFTMLLIYEIIFDIAMVRGSLGHEGDHSLYKYFSSIVPDFSSVTRYDVLNLAHYYAEFMRLCMTVFDVPEVVAIHRSKICEAGFSSLSRVELWTYYVSVFPYFWVFATPVVGAVFGTYLYVALNVFGCHYNEAFSALRISSYKNFLRLHFTPTGDLELFAFGIDKMPRKWVRDPSWSGGSPMLHENHLPSYKWTKPSFWKPLVSKMGYFLRPDFENRSFDGKFNAMDRSNVQLIDHILIPKPLSFVPKEINLESK